MAGNPGLFFKGDVKVQRYNPDGTLSPVLYGPIGGTKLSFKPQNESIHRLSKERATFGKIVGSVFKGKPTQITLDFNEADAKMLALIFLGTDAALNVTSGSVTGESLTAVHNQWVKLVFENVSAPVITGKTMGTDYLLDANLGAIKVLSTGSIADGASVTINYTHGAVTGAQILAGTQSNVAAKIWFDGENLESGDQVMVIVPKALLSPKSDIDFLSDKHIDAQADGELQFLGSETAEFYVRSKVIRA